MRRQGLLLLGVLGVLVVFHPQGPAAAQTFRPNALPPGLVEEADRLPDLNQRNCCTHRDCFPALVFVIRQRPDVTELEIDGQRAFVATPYVGISPSSRSWVCVEPQHVPAIRAGVSLGEVLARDERAVRCAYVGAWM